MKRDWIDIATLTVLTLTLTFVVIYTIITGYMASISKDTARRQLRAYVHVLAGQIRLVNINQEGMGLDIGIELRNSGQTPAYDFSTWIEQPVVQVSDAVPFTIEKPMSDRDGFSITAPGGSVNLRFVIPISEDDLSAIRQGEKKVFVWGGTNYTDAFGDERYTRFRMINGPIYSLNKAGDVAPLAPHRIGYDAN